MTTKEAHTPGALRAAKLMAINPKVRQLALGIILREEFSNELAEIIDRETGALEMLNALKAFQKYFGGKNRDTDVVMLTIAEDPSTMQEVQEKVEAAIHKAEGT